MPETPNPLLDELSSLDPSLIPLLNQRDAAAQLVSILPGKYPPEEVSQLGRSARAWELAGLFFRNEKRFHEALPIFSGLYDQMLAAQNQSTRVHKGTPLLWIADCFMQLGFPVHAKRYLMLTLCEDAVTGGGEVSPEITGAYFRLVWIYGLPDQELKRYARRFAELGQELGGEALYPEAILQRVDDGWLTELPSPPEASSYRVNSRYAKHLLDRLGSSRGEALEVLAEYFMSCMPGCRTRRRGRSGSTDYDIICAMEGFEVDFRSEFGRYFVCECKDWASPADFTAMAKFCRVLDSVKSRFGVLFSKEGISGAGKTQFADRELLKVFQDRGIVIVVLSLADLQEVASGASLIAMLKARYEHVRLDLYSQRTL